MNVNVRDEDLDIGVVDSDQKLRDKIIFVMTLYPQLSPSMLHTGIGPNVAPQLWRPIVDSMVKEGTIIRSDEGVMTHLEQYRTFTVLRLRDDLYTASCHRFGIRQMGTSINALT